MNNCVSKILYNCIKFGTILFEHCKQSYKIISPFIDPTLCYFSNEKRNMDNNNIIASLNSFNKKCSIITDNDVDYIIVRNSDDNLNTTNNIYEKCNISLMSITLIINDDNIIEIDIKNKKNFYIIDNEIDSVFIKWYINYFYKTDFKDNDKLILSILDNNCNLNEINIKTTKIRLKKDSYEII